MEVFRGRIQRLFAKGFNTSILQKSRLDWVDYLRGLAIILIVYRHVLIGIQRGNIEVPQGLIDANMVFYSFRMPLFFILSGIFISKSLAKKSVKQLIGKKFELLLYPYLIWAFLQLTLQIAFSQMTNSDRSLINYTYILYNPRSLDQFWYLPALFNTTLIYLLVKTKLKANTPIQLCLGLCLYFLSPLFQQVSMISDWMAFYFFFALGDAISELFFGQHTQRFFKNPVSLLLILPVFIVAQRYYLQHDLGKLAVHDSHVSNPNYLVHIKDQIDFIFIALVGCLSMFILAFQIQRFKALSFLRIVGYHSLHIYVMHVILTAFIRLSLIVVFGITNPIVLLFTSIAIGVVIPILVYNFLIKDGPLYFLFHLHRQRAKEAVPVPELKPEVVPIQAAAIPPPVQKTVTQSSVA
jgi:fucose 4-O-acetylase-like acetyltransferase